MEKKKANKLRAEIEIPISFPAKIAKQGSHSRIITVPKEYWETGIIDENKIYHVSLREIGVRKPRKKDDIKTENHPPGLTLNLEEIINDSFRNLSEEEREKMPKKIMENIEELLKEKKGKGNEIDIGLKKALDNTMINFSKKRFKIILEDIKRKLIEKEQKFAIISLENILKSEQ